MSVLILNCSARTENSISRELTQYLADCLKQPFVIRDLGSSLFPPISGQDLIDLHNGRHIERDSLIHQHTIATELIEELKAASTLVIGAPLYNFTVPTVLKQWIDYVLQPGLTFKYGPNGPVGLCSHIQKAFVITTSGGTTVGGKLDFASPYLELICNFIGVQNVIKINAGGSKKERADIIQHAEAQIDHQLSIQRIPIQKQLRRTANTVLTVN